MSKILNSVLDNVSESNNEYRKELRKLNTIIDEKTTALVGELVTASNYTLDFSSAIASAKEKLINPISRIIESYVIKDLRSVEMVNEQFVEKINDKIENTEVKTSEDKKAFIESLDKLLNEKYLEIVKIKRIPFVGEDGTNEEVEGAIKSYIEFLNTQGIDLNTFANYKKEIYGVIGTALERINSLYLNNFVGEVGSALNTSVDYTEPVEEETKEEYKPFIPDIKPMIPEVEEQPVNVIPPVIENKPVNVMPPVIEEQEEETLTIIDEERLPKLAEFVPPVVPEKEEVKEEVMVNTPIDDTKKPYDVEEILKIAKSPVVTLEDIKKNEETPKEDYLSVAPITKQEEIVVAPEAVFNEREIVEEMIRRLSNRLQEIDAKEASLNDEEDQVEEDEAFVNDLINSSNSKKAELDRFEEELNNKTEELKVKQKELDEKINNVMPFAKALMENDK